MKLGVALTRYPFVKTRRQPYNYSVVTLIKLVKSVSIAVSFAVCIAVSVVPLLNSF